LNLLDSRDRRLIDGTVAKMPALKEVSGGWRRVTCILTDPKIYEYWYERQEFLFVNYSLAEAYLRLGRPKDADAIVDRMVSKSARDHFFVPEMYVSVLNPLFKGELGEPTGAIPMVGYGAGAYVLYRLQRR
jgi:GH15 family glucan-1,4-alpha-glucosidase